MNIFKKLLTKRDDNLVKTTTNLERETTDTTKRSIITDRMLDINYIKNKTEETRKELLNYTFNYYIRLINKAAGQGHYSLHLKVDTDTIDIDKLLKRLQNIGYTAEFIEIIDTIRINWKTPKEEN